MSPELNSIMSPELNKNFDDVFRYPFLDLSD
jgi:hypothetical protein